MALLPHAEEGGPNPFSIKDRSKREDLHFKLVEKADAGRRKEKGGSGSTSRLEQLRGLEVTPGRTPTPRFASGPVVGGRKGVGGMTPAAQRLAGRIGTPGRSGGAFEGERSGRGGWGATPRVRREV